MSAEESIAVLEDIKTRVTEARLWFGFPHYVVLGWALLVSYTLFHTVQRLDVHMHDANRLEGGINNSIATMADAIHELQDHTQELREDSIRTRLILEMRFPKEAQQVDQAFGGEK